MTVSAAGYEPFEHFLPELAGDAPAGELRVELHPVRDDAVVHDEVLADTGCVHCRLAVPTASGAGSVSILWPLPEPDAPNTRIRRGCPVPAGSLACVTAAIGADRTCKLQGPPGRYFLSLSTPEYGRSFHGPIDVTAGAELHVDLDPRASGAIRGTVEPVPVADRGHVWVVAFDGDVVCAEARVQPDGSFAIGALPAGRYGVRVGDDDQLRRRWDEWEGPLHLSDHEHDATPWAGARLIDVVAGAATDVVLER